MKSSVMSWTILVSLFAGALVFLLLTCANAQAQVTIPPVPDASESGNQRQKDVDSPWVLQQKREMAKKQNEMRQQDIKKDTEKLLELATELKQYVDKTNENILSMDVVKKAEEIEKLAHSVRERMKGQ